VSRSLWDKKRDVLHHYDRLARTYDSLYGQEQNAKIALILKILKTGCKDLVLDAGCGTGLLIEHVAMEVNHFVGIDLSKKSLKMALARSHRLRIKRNVSLIQADADSLPFRDDIFDKIFALTLLQNAPEPCKTLQEMIRVAKSNSQIVVTGLKKHFSEGDFSKLIGSIGWEYTFAEAQRVHDLVAIVKVNKVKNKYRQKEEVGR